MIKLEHQIPDSQIYFSDKADEFHSLLPEKQVVVLTDDKVASLYSGLLNPFPVISIGRGERVKTLETVQSIVSELIRFQADRESFLLGVGGGIVCDIAGFVASVFMRGIPFGLVPTTLLAQTDAAIGGKNGVNFSDFKNIIGVFAQARFTFISPAFLRTLDEEEYINGMAEVIKHALIADREFLTFLEDNQTAILRKSVEVLMMMIQQSVEIKTRIVAADVRENGLRRILNFGHTFAHAIEKESGLPHGKGVALGMRIASELSFRKGWITEEELSRIIVLIKRYRLPDQWPVNVQNLLKWVVADKKKAGNELNFVFLNSPGKAEVEKISFDFLEQVKDFDFLKEG